MTLDRSTDDSSYDESNWPLYGNIITALSAVGGGIAGSFFTYWHNRKIEDRKHQQVKELEEQKKKEERESEKENDRKLREIVHEDLRVYSIALDRIIKEPENTVGYIEVLHYMLKYHRQYPSLPFERRIRAFSLDNISKIERAYNETANFVEMYMEKLGKDPTVEERRRIGEGSKVTVKEIKRFVEEALKSLKEESV